MALETEGLTVRLGGREVLRDISLSLRPGQLTGVLGLNGAGKTTLIGAILGFCPIAAGEVRVDGEAVAGMRAARRARLLSYVPQGDGAGVRFPVEDFVSMGVTAYLGPFSRPGRKDRQRAGEVLEALGCAHLAGRAMDRLSGGERRMAYLARAVVQNARWLLLDEPVASLDFSRQHSFLASLRRYVRGQGVGCLMTIHDPRLAWDYCDRLVLLHGSRVLEDVFKGESGARERLEAALGTLYGPQASVKFQDGKMSLGWTENILKNSVTGLDIPTENGII